MSPVLFIFHFIPYVSHTGSCLYISYFGHGLLYTSIYFKKPCLSLTDPIFPKFYGFGNRSYAVHNPESEPRDESRKQASQGIHLLGKVARSKRRVIVLYPGVTLTGCSGLRLMVVSSVSLVAPKTGSGGRNKLRRAVFRGVGGVKLSLPDYVHCTVTDAVKYLTCRLSL